MYREREKGKEHGVGKSEAIEKAIGKAIGKAKVEEKGQGKATGAGKRKKKMKLGKRIRPYLEEIMRVLRLAWPVVLTEVLIFAFNMEDLIAVGLEFDSTTQAGVGLAISWTFGTLVFGLGMTTACDTIMFQASGTGNMHLVGLTMYRGLVSMIGVSIPIMMMWYWTEPIMILLGIEETVARAAGIYAVWMIPGLLPLLFFFVGQKFLAALEIVYPTMVISFIGVVLNLIGNILFVKWDMGLRGIAVATSIARFVMCFILGIYTFFGKTKKIARIRAGMKDIIAWKPLREFIWLALVGAVQTGLECWGFEILTILAGQFGDVALSAHTIMFNVYEFLWNVSFGVSIAASVRIGHFLGKKMAVRAKKCTFLSAGLGTVCMTINAIFVFIFRHNIGSIYSNDPEVIELVAQIAVYNCICMSFDGFSTVLVGALRSMGRQHTGVVIVLMSLYAVGITCAAIFAFVLDWGLVGIWRGLTIGLVLFFLTSLLFLTTFTDWKKEAQKAMFARSKQRDEEDSGMSMDEFPHVGDEDETNGLGGNDDDDDDDDGEVSEEEEDDEEEEEEDVISSKRNASKISFDIHGSESDSEP